MCRYLFRNRTSLFIGKLSLIVSVEKAENDYRVNLPERDGEEEWKLFDVSLAVKEGYDEFTCNFQLNPVLSVHYIYQNLIDLLKKQ